MSVDGSAPLERSLPPKQVVLEGWKSVIPLTTNHSTSNDMTECANKEARFIDTLGHVMVGAIKLVKSRRNLQLL